MKRKIATVLSVIFCCNAIFAGVTLKSPDKDIVFTLDKGAEGLEYSIAFKGEPLICTSALGFEFRDGYFGDMIAAACLHVWTTRSFALWPLSRTGHPGECL